MAALTRSAGGGKYNRCFNMFLLNSLKTNNASQRIKICMYTGSDPYYLANYNAETKTITIGENYGFGFQTLVHELIHALQDRIYPNGITQYSNIGKSDIEFEVAVFQDLMRYVEGGEWPPRASNSTDYRNFINNLTDNGQHLFNAKNFFSQENIHFDYFTYIEGFKVKYPQYNKPTANLTPLGLRKLLEESGCVEKFWP